MPIDAKLSYPSVILAFLDQVFHGPVAFLGRARFVPVRHMPEAALAEVKKSRYRRRMCRFRNGALRRCQIEQLRKRGS